MEPLEGVIGVIAGTQVPWTAQSPVYKTPSRDKQLAHRVRALHLKQNKLNKFRVVCVMESGQEVFAPAVKQIRIQNTEFGHCSLVTWEFEEIELKQPVIINKICLIDDLGFRTTDISLTHHIKGQIGDIIKLSSISIQTP